MSRVLRPFALAIALLAAGCGERPDDDETRDAAPADTLRASVVATIGVLEGPPEYTFGNVMSVAADDSGRIYVVDDIGPSVRVYDRDGAWLARIVGAGRGPGELEWATDLTFDDAGRLYVRGDRILVFAPARDGAIADSLVATWTLDFYANTRPRRARIDSAGHYLYPVDVGRDSLAHFYLPFADGRQTGDTLAVPEYANIGRDLTSFVRTSPNGGRIVEGFAAAPFSARPAWDVTPAGTLLSGDGAESQLYETDASGDTLRTIRLPAQARAVPAQELDDSIAALDARTDSLPVPSRRS